MVLKIMRRYFSHSGIIKSLVLLMAFHLFNVSVNVNDRLLPKHMSNEIESIFELVSMHLFGEDAALPDNPNGEDEGQVIVGQINITWFLSNPSIITPASQVDIDELPTDEKLPIARPLFYTSPSYPTDTPPPKMA